MGVQKKKKNVRLSKICNFLAISRQSFLFYLLIGQVILIVLKLDVRRDNTIRPQGCHSVLIVTIGGV